MTVSEHSGRLGMNPAGVILDTSACLRSLLHICIAQHQKTESEKAAWSIFTGAAYAYNTSSHHLLVLSETDRRVKSSFFKVSCKKRTCNTAIHVPSTTESNHEVPISWRWQNKGYVLWFTMGYCCPGQDIRTVGYIVLRTESCFLQKLHQEAGNPGRNAFWCLLSNNGEETRLDEHRLTHRNKECGSSPKESPPSPLYSPKSSRAQEPTYRDHPRER